MSCFAYIFSIKITVSIESLTKLMIYKKPNEFKVKMPSLKYIEEGILTVSFFPVFEVTGNEACC